MATPRSRAPLTCLAVLCIVALGAGLTGCYTPPDPRPLWAEHCAKCHGPDGRGDPRRAHTDPGLDLSRSPMVAAKANGRIYTIIKSGAPAMPGYAHKLEYEELDALTAFVLAIEQQTPPEDTGSGDQP